MEMEITEKRCRKCGDIKNSSNFYRKKKSADGLQSICKDCANKYARDYKRAQRNKRRKTIAVIENLPNEEWRDVIGYEGLYMVSNLGRVKRLSYVMKNVSGSYVVPEKLRSIQTNPQGYSSLVLWKNNKHHVVTVHRLVAMAFIPNPNNYPHINHLDSDRANPKADNLEWCTRSHNMRWAYDTNNMRSKLNPPRGEEHHRSVRVAMISKSGEQIKTFACISDAAREIGVVVGSISNCINGKSKSSGGYIWKRI